MLQAILLILKILGIVLLVIVGILLIVLLAVLFAAARYRIRASKDETVQVSADVRWLFGIVTVRTGLTRICGSACSVSRS